MNRREVLAAVSAGALLTTSDAWTRQAIAASLEESQLSDVVMRFMREFEIPGIAIGIVLPDGAPRMQGFGVRVLGHSAAVDASTGFAIASNSKSFLAACLALLVDSGKLGWDDPVVKHLPEFRMYDPVITRMMTVCDLLVHRSGLPLGAGDLMQFPKTDHTREEILGPAGGINVSVAGVMPWLAVQLSRGLLPDGRRLWSEAQAAQMWLPRTIIASGPGPTAAMPQQSVMQGYALGWGVSDYRGHRMLSHAGGLAGQITRTTLMPEQGIGLVVFSNSEEGEAISGLRYALLDQLLGLPLFDWSTAMKQSQAQAQEQVLALVGNGDFPAPAGVPSLPLQRYVGRYRDPWYGDIVIAQRRGQLTVAVANGGVTGITMRALSPLADFSFDFHHLRFAPVGS